MGQWREDNYETAFPEKTIYNRCTTTNNCRVPDKFSRQGTSTKNSNRSIPMFPLNCYKFSINLSGHVADFVRF